MLMQVKHGHLQMTQPAHNGCRHTISLTKVNILSGSVLPFGITWPGSTSRHTDVAPACLAASGGLCKTKPRPWEDSTRGPTCRGIEVTAACDAAGQCKYKPTPQIDRSLLSGWCLPIHTPDKSGQPHLQHSPGQNMPEASNGESWHMLGEACHFRISRTLPSDQGTQKSPTYRNVCRHV